MSRKWLLFPFCLSVLFMLTPLSRASLTLRVNESATRFCLKNRLPASCSQLKTLSADA